MKSFFKKLAFVMAMAMVVSLAAPAAANAATVLQAAEQESKEVVTKWTTSNVGDTKDLCFLGAPEGWRDLERGWESSDETVVTVDDNGLMTTTGYGTAVVTFEMEGCESAIVVVEVEEAVAPETFEVVQKSDTQLAINFAGETTYGANDVSLYIVYPNYNNPAEPIEVKWPIEEAKKDGNVITITPFVSLGDGDTYKVVVGDLEPATVETKIGEITKIVITPAKTEVYTETAVKVTPKLYSGDVDLTDYYINLVDIEYTVTLSEGSQEDMEYDVNDNFELTMKFYEVGMTAGVKAVVKNNKDVVLATSNNTSVSSIPKKAWSFEAVVTNWALIANDATKVDWNKKSVPANKSAKGEYSIVLQFKDSEGTTYVTHPKAVQEDDDTAAENVYIDGADAISAAHYEVLFYSANKDLMLVDEETGAVGVYTPCTGVFYIGLNYFGGEEDVLRYIYAGEVTVDTATKLSEVKPGATTATVVTDALDASFEEQAKVELITEDQYDDAWTEVSFSATYKTANDTSTAIGNACFVTEGGKNYIVLTGDDLALANDKVERVYIKATSTDPLNPAEVSTYIDVTIKTPKYVSATDKTIVLDLETKNRYEEYTQVALKDTEADLHSTTEAEVDVQVKLYKVSNGANVGLYSKNEVDEMKFVGVQDENHLKTLTQEGTRYVIVRDKNNNIIPIDWVDDTLTFTLNEVKDGEMVYAATGAYSVKAVTVRYNNRNGLRNDYEVKATINVKNTAPTVTYAGILDDEFSANCVEVNPTTGKITNVDLAEVVLETLKFKKGNDAWTPEYDEITDVKAVVVGDSVIIQYVVLEVTLGNGAYTEVTIVPTSVVSVKYNKAKVVE